jgi:SAM-dependent methyltransferase
MAHPDQLQFVGFVSRFAPQHFARSRVLEIGSLDINGSVRMFFLEPARYVGIDVADGPGVDRVCLGHEFHEDPGGWDAVLSCESFEHNPHYRETFANMIRLARPGALVLFTCATSGRPEHGTSRTSPEASPLTVERGWTYYRNLSQSDFPQAELEEAFDEYAFFRNLRSADLYFAGLKRGAGERDRTAFGDMRTLLTAYYRAGNRRPRYLLQQATLVILERLGPIGVLVHGLRRRLRKQAPSSR